MEDNSRPLARTPPFDGGSNEQNKQPPPKLRSSCDRCSGSKVRCDQERPACHRCQYSGVQCVYGVSRRMGKPPKSQTNGNKNETVKQAAMKNMTSADQTESLLETPLVATGFNSRAGGKVSPLPQDTTTHDTFCPDYDMSDVEYKFISDHPFLASSEMSLEDEINVDSIFNSYDESMNQLTQAHCFNQRVLSSLGDVKLWDLNGGSFNSSSASSNSMVTRVDDTPSPFDMLASPMKHARTALSLDHQYQVHKSSSCMHLTSSILHNLSFPSGFCTTFPNHVPDSTIDKVLDTSRHAMTMLYKLLRCSCAQTSSSALSIALTILKILDSYCVIARSVSTSPSTLMSFANQPAQNMVLDTPITVGMYKIDAEDEHRVILLLLLSELRRVRQLVEAFARRYCPSSGSNGNRSREAMAEDGRGFTNQSQMNDGGGGEGSIYTALEHFMSSKISMVRTELSRDLVGDEEGNSDVFAGLSR